MTAEGNSLATMALIEELIAEYDISLSIQKEIYKDKTSSYRVLVVWPHDVIRYLDGKGDTLFDAVSAVYDEIKTREDDAVLTVFDEIKGRPE